ncbi:MAG: tyrosine-type recombinase/integrase [Chloroflexi bacterium]|nr:tyrosine-type recombinase/integrase [Chloroflexota bacterium]MBI5704194.1 tyrosine-type recombinase/integrase [Chloroflexota bacterium]
MSASSDFPQRTKQTRRWNLASLASFHLLDAYTDFMLSRQAMNCTPATLSFYQYTAGRFLSWCEAQGVTTPEEVTARLVRQYLATLADKADRTLHAHARAIKTMLRFWHKENYLPGAVTFEMPRIVKKRLPRLTEDELRQVLKACNARDRAIVLLMVDSGLRRAEVCALDWQDVDMQTGAITVRRGKGRKPRLSRIGAVARRALLAYRRTLKDRDGALFRSKGGGRLTGPGLMLIFRRLSKRTGIYVTAHALRRTWTILALRAGMDVLHVQALGGWTDLEMVNYYASLEDEDLLQAHARFSPVDNLDR